MSERCTSISIPSQVVTVLTLLLHIKQTGPSIGEQSIGEPSIGEQSIGEPSIGEPSIGEPSIGEPSIGEPSIGESKDRVDIEVCQFNKLN